MIDIVESQKTQLELLETFQKVAPEPVLFEDKADCEAWFQENLPQLEWDRLFFPPGDFQIKLIASSQALKSPNKWENLLLDVVRYCLSSFRELSITSFNHGYFPLSHLTSGLVFVGHVHFFIQDSHEWIAVRTALEAWSRDIRHDPMKILHLNKQKVKPQERIVGAEIQKYHFRYPALIDEGIHEDETLFFDLVNPERLQNCTPQHIFKLILSLYWIRRQILRKITQTGSDRQLLTHLIPAHLFFPFSRKNVLGCLIGAYWIDRHEHFDEEHIFKNLEKILPTVEVIRNSVYFHPTKQGLIRLLYFEIEKKNQEPFSSQDRKTILKDFIDRLQEGFPKLSPAVFMRRNEDEVYKNILYLSQYVLSPYDIPQVFISLESQNQEQVSFLITLVSPMQHDITKIKSHFTQLADMVVFKHEKSQIARYLEGGVPVKAHLFSLQVSRDPSLLRSDDSLNFYLARQKVASFLEQAVGKFRDFNGGLLIKQAQLLLSFREKFKGLLVTEDEALEDFFYAITPLENQAVLDIEVIAQLFKLFLEGLRTPLKKESDYFLKTYQDDTYAYLSLRVKDKVLMDRLSAILSAAQNTNFELISSVFKYRSVFSLSFVAPATNEVTELVAEMQKIMQDWHEERKNCSILRISFQYSFLSLDPRIGGDSITANLIRLLFEGLTRINTQGQIENGIAHSINISEDKRQYTFKLRDCKWNNGTQLTAHDFEYSWKQTLLPHFITSFVHLFYPIKNAKEAKQGLVSLEEVGIRAIDDTTLVVHLSHPTPYFLQLVAHPVYSPVHRIKDQQAPGWPHQAAKQYPCNGPYELLVQHSQQGYKFVRNPLYWDQAQSLPDQVIFIRASSEESLEMLHRGEIDWIGNPFGYCPSSYILGPGEKLLTWPNRGVFWAIFNTQKFPFNNVHLRQALALAICREELVTAVPPPAHIATSPFLFHHRLTDISMDEDPDAAKKLLETALKELYLKKGDLPPITISLTEGRLINSGWASILKRQWEAVLGIRCRLEVLEWDTLFEKMAHGAHDITLAIWESWIDDPIYLLNNFRHANEDLNFAKWEHPKVQQLLHNADNEFDPEHRLKFLAQAEEIILGEVPVIPLFDRAFQTLVKEERDVVFPGPMLPLALPQVINKAQKKGIVL